MHLKCFKAIRIVSGYEYLFFRSSYIFELEPYDLNYSRQSQANLEIQI